MLNNSFNPRYEDLKDELLKIKSQYVSLIKTKKEIIKKLTNLQTEIDTKFKNKNLNSVQKFIKFCDIINSIAQIGGKIDLGVYGPSKEKYYLDINHFQTYEFTVNFKHIAEKLMNKKVVEKTLHLNIINIDSECTSRDENPYYCLFEDFYYPIELQVYCDENLDDSKKYTIKELQNLIRTKKIICKTGLTLSDSNKVKVKDIINAEIAKFDFRLGNVEYKEKDNVEFSRKFLGDKNNNIVNFSKLKDKLNLKYLDSDLQEIQKEYGKFYVLYPNLVDVFKEEIELSIASQKEGLKKLIEKDITTFKTRIKHYLIDTQKEIRKVQRNINRINDNSKIYNIEERIFGE